MLNFNRFIIVFTLLICFTSCNNEAKKEKKDESTKNTTIVIDSTAFKAEKKDYKIESVVKDVVLSSKAEVITLVKSIDEQNLDKQQKFAQEFFIACAQQDYSKAASFLAYKGTDASRNNKASYDASIANEKSVVKTTVDVIFGFLAESSNYKFVSSKEKVVSVGKVQNLEITFFKKGLGINRLFFEVIDTENGMLIYNMK